MGGPAAREVIATVAAGTVVRPPAEYVQPKSPLVLHLTRSPTRASTVRPWESGTQKPCGIARKMLSLVDSKGLGIWGVQQYRGAHNTVRGITN